MANPKAFGKKRRELSLPHKNMLERESGITPAAIAERGYWTETDPKVLISLGFTEDQARVPALVIPIWGVDGEIVSYQIRPDEPRTKDGKPVKYESLPETSPRIDIPPSVREMIADPGEPLWITEGVKKADSGAVRGMCVVALVGVWLWRGSNAKGGSVALADWESIALKGRVVYIAFDSDIMTKSGVREAMIRLAAFLKRRKVADIRPVIIPSQSDDKVGLDDYLNAGGTVNELKRCVNKSVLDRPGIVVNNRHLVDLTEDALEIIRDNNDPPQVFVRTGELVRVVTDERGVSKLQPLSKAALKGKVSRWSQWLRADKDGATSPSRLPDDVAEDILALGHWEGVPPVITVTKSPVLSADGVLTTTPGYNPESHYYLDMNEPVPEWEGSVESAVAFIRDDMLCDFPFDGEAEFANAIALLLHPIVRPYINSATPLHLFTAPTPGTGKSLLATILLMPTCGNSIAVTPETRNEEEWRKRITTILLSGKPYVFFDNLKSKLDSASVEAALTSKEWEDRMLSTNESITVPIRCAWVATANNPEVGLDVSRRIARIKLDSKLEKPGERKGFKHTNIEGWVITNRAKILSALCKIVRTWLDANKPTDHAVAMGSYQDWVGVMGGILMTAGVPGFLTNFTESQAELTPETDSWEGFYERWYEKFGHNVVKPTDLMEIFDEDDVLAARVTGKDERGRRANLGRALTRRRGMPVGGYRIEIAATKTHGSQSYMLLGGDNARSGGDTSVFPTHIPTHTSTLFPDSSGVSDSSSLLQKGGDSGDSGDLLYAREKNNQENSDGLSSENNAASPLSPPFEPNTEQKPGWGSPLHPHPASELAEGEEVL